MDQMWTRMGSDLIARMNERMKFRDSRSRLFLAILVALAALAFPGGPVWGSQATRPVPPPADGGWPRAYTTATGGHIVLYQPQVASWPGQKHMTLYAAVSYQAQDAGTPTLGTIRVEADTSVAVAERLPEFSPVSLSQTTFPRPSRDPPPAPPLQPPTPHPPQ